MQGIAFSARKPKDIPIGQYLDETFSMVVDDPITEADSVFGFSEHTPLYGGRYNGGVEITDEDLAWMYSNGINYRIPLTNHYITPDRYEESLVFLDKHHREGNSIITVDEWLAKQIRKDFPLYQLEASVIKEVSLISDLERALGIYDTVVPFHQSFAKEEDWLRIPEEFRERVRLFVTLNCAFKCSNRMCYKSFSHANIGNEFRFTCSQQYERTKPKSVKESYLLDMEAMREAGFVKFKMVPVHRQQLFEIDRIGNETFKRNIRQL